MLLTTASSIGKCGRTERAVGISVTSKRVVMTCVGRTCLYADQIGTSFTVTDGGRGCKTRRYRKHLGELSPTYEGALQSREMKEFKDPSLWSKIYPAHFLARWLSRAGQRMAERYSETIRFLAKSYPDR